MESEERMLEDLDRKQKDQFQPSQLKVKSLVEALATNQRQPFQPLIKVPKEYKLMNKIALNNVEVRPQDYIERDTTRGEKLVYEYDPDGQNMKADLVRRNLLSRKDLMLLYRPPIKNSAIPANNPFLTKSILQPRHGKGRNQTIGQSVDQAMAVDHRGGSQRSPRSSTFYSQNDFAAEMITPPNFAV